MRILFVQPHFCPSKIGFYLVAQPEPLALETLAAATPDHDMSLVDLRVHGDLSRALDEFAPDIVAVTALTTEVYAAQSVLRDVKAHSKEIFTIVGGHHATLVPEDFQLDCVDAICLGEGDCVLPAVVERLAARKSLESVPGLMWRDKSGSFVRNPQAPAGVDLNAIAVPRRDLAASNFSEYFMAYFRPDTAVATGRGCPYRCNFCSVAEFYDGRTCQMSPEKVVEEILAAQTDHITFVDDNFLMNHRRALQIAERIKSADIARRYSLQARTDSIARHPEVIERWAEVGLHGTLLGLEGASDAMLQSVEKRNTAQMNDEAIRILHANGVVIWGAFIVDPDWTVDDFALLRDYVLQNNITHTQFTVLTPLPGTKLYQQRRGELLTDDYTCYDALHSVLPTRLPREEFYRQFAMLYQTYSLGAAYDLILKKQVVVQDFKRSYQSFKALGQWENYVVNDPVLRSPSAAQA